MPIYLQSVSFRFHARFTPRGSTVVVQLVASVKKRKRCIAFIWSLDFLSTGKKLAANHGNNSALAGKTLQLVDYENIDTHEHLKLA